MPASRRWVRILSLAITLAAFPAALLVPGMETAVLLLSPAIVMLAMLCTGLYVGEERLARLAAAWQQRCPQRPRAALPAASRRPHVLVPRGGRLVGTSLAVRPPPAPLAVR